jgi:hypothetical protein
MNHERFKEWLYLSVFDELGEDETHLLAEHVVSCEECQQEREEIVRMLESITASGAGEPSEEMLQSAQRSLRAALWKESLVHTTRRDPARREPLSVLSRWFGAGRRELDGAVRGGWLGGYRAGLAAAAMVSFGFVIGYLTFDRLHPVSPVPQERQVADGPYSGISNIHFLDADAADGEVDIIYDQIRPMRLKTRMDDQRLREVLAYALLKGENPGVRLKAINAFETNKSASPPADMKQAFLEALNSDPNAGVRLQALLVLRRLPFDEDIKSTLLFVLSHDENPGIRIAAMNYLAEIAIDGIIPEQEMYDILNTRMTADRNNSVQNGPSTHIEEAD